MYNRSTSIALCTDSTPNEPQGSVRLYIVQLVSLNKEKSNWYFIMFVPVSDTSMASRSTIASGHSLQSLGHGHQLLRSGWGDLKEINTLNYQNLLSQL